MKIEANKTNPIFPAILLLLALCLTSESNSQEMAPSTEIIKGTVHIPKETFPKGNVLNLVHGWGGMTVAINEPKAGTDFTPILKGLKDDLCQVPHWGYLEKGRIRVFDIHKNSQTIKAGAVFYLAPGHTIIVDEDARMIDFSPEKEMKELNAFVQNKIAQMQKNK